MTVLITGVGVVGSQAARCLVERGERPVLVDVAPQADAIGGIVDLSAVEMVTGDVLDPDGLARIIKDHDVTDVIHTVANPMLTLGAHQNPRAAIELNIMGTVNVLEAARTEGLRRVVVSSSNTAGQHIEGGRADGDNAYEEAYPRPVTVYASTKLAIENIGLAYNRWNGVDFAAVRYGAVMGPWGGAGGGGGPTTVFRRVIDQALAGEEVLIPSMAFEWVYSRDAGEGTVLALYADDLKTRVFNITMGCVVTAAEFAGAVRQVFPGASVRIDDTPGGGMKLPDSHVPSNMDLARDALGFAPQFGILEAVSDLRQWVEAHN